MKKRLAVVTDSTAVLPQEMLEKHDNLYSIPLQILMKEDVYKDGIDIKPDEFFDLIGQSSVLPTTSQPSVGDVLDLFEELVEQYESILYITISSKISGTFSTGMLARNQLKNHNIQVFDSLNTSVIQLQMVDKALQMSKDNKSLEEIIRQLETARESSRIYLVVDDLKHLGRTGRVNNVSAVVGAMLKIKPILHFEDGVINLAKKVRTINKAHNEVLRIFKDAEIKNHTKVMIAHAHGIEYAKKLRDKVSEVHPDKEIYIGELSPVISVHTGPNTVGIAWID